MLGYNPPSRHPPRSRQPPSKQTTPPPPADHAGRYGQRAGGTHPTGMQSCWSSSTVVFQVYRLWCVVTNAHNSMIHTSCDKIKKEWHLCAFLVCTSFLSRITIFGCVMCKILLWYHKYYFYINGIISGVKAISMPQCVQLTKSLLGISSDKAVCRTLDPEFESH